jgi:phosphatidylglycerophosphate synthase
MFDAPIRPYINLPLNWMGRKISHLGISANAVTLMGFSFGLGAIGCILQGNYLLGALFLVFNRLFDGLDGAVARSQGLSDFGGFLDIVCDFIIYSGIVFAFGIHDSNKLIYAAFLIFSFVGPITSFLAYSILAAKNNIQTTKRGEKSFYYLGGICEGTETTLTLFLLCLIPDYFSIICIVYGCLCWITTIGRTYNAFTDFKN